MDDCPEGTVTPYKTPPLKIETGRMYCCSKKPRSREVTCGHCAAVWHLCCAKNQGVHFEEPTAEMIAGDDAWKGPCCQCCRSTRCTLT